MNRYDTVFAGFGLDAAFESAILKVYIGKLDQAELLWTPSRITLNEYHINEILIVNMLLEL